VSTRALRVAVFTPLPPARTGVADYAASLLPVLGKELELEVYVDQRNVACRAVAERFAVRHLLQFAPRASTYDAVLYEMGNSLAHAGLFELSGHYPGIVHLHDLVLHHFLLAFYERRGQRRDRARYFRELVFSHEREGLRLARCVDRGFGGSLGYFALPARGRVVERAVGAIVHSDWARRELRRERPSLPILRIEHPCFPRPRPVSSADARRYFGIPAEGFVVATVGFVTPAKRLDRLLAAIRALRQERLELWLLVVGEEAPEVALLEEARALGIADRCRFVGYVPEEELWRAIDAADVVAALRYPTAGEASGPLMRALAAGKPAIVTDLAQFRELPPEVCVKVPLGSREVGAIVAAIRDLATRPELRERMAAAASRFASGAASPERAARAIAAFVRSLRPLCAAALRTGIDRMGDARRRTARRLARRFADLGEAAAVQWAVAIDELAGEGMPPGAAAAPAPGDGLCR
jgi:glycosyltransferase involved in cell wall biosynthesis